jgi:hypothetical protein
MNILFPYSSPQILNDSRFLSFGGQTGTSSAAMRQAAYLIAEEDVSFDIGSYLLPTIVTGQYPYNSAYKVETQHGYVNSILGAWVVYNNLIWCSCDLNLVSTCAIIQDDTYGYVDFLPIYNSICGLCGAGNSGVPYKFQLAYNAGLPTGTSMTSPKILMALTIVAQINLNEMLHYGNESVGDIGVAEFRSLDYSERRYGLKRTVYGSSAEANRAHRLLSGIRKNRGVMI